MSLRRGAERVVREQRGSEQGEREVRRMNGREENNQAVGDVEQSIGKRGGEERESAKVSS